MYNTIYREDDYMSNDKKNVVTGYHHIVKDLLDNYDRYSDAEKKAIKKAFPKMWEKLIYRFGLSSFFSDVLTELAPCF